MKSGDAPLLTLEWLTWYIGEGCSYLHLNPGFISHKDKVVLQNVNRRRLSRRPVPC